jgi:fibronectin-binding autotransporter adhesin
MKTITSQRCLATVALLLLSFWLSESRIHAQNYYRWNAPSGGNYGSTGNWLYWNGSAYVPSSTIPGASDTVYFDSMNSGAYALSTTSRTVTNHYAQGISTLRFGDGNTYATYTATNMLFSPNASQTLYDGTFSIGYADIWTSGAGTRATLTVTGANTLANINNVRTSGIYAFSNSSGSFRVSNGAIANVENLIHSWTNPFSDFDNYVVSGTNTLLRAYGTTFTGYAGLRAENGGMLDFSNITSVTGVGQIRLSNGVLFAIDLSTSSTAFSGIHGHGIVAFRSLNTSDYSIGTSITGAVDIQSNFALGNLNTNIHSNTIAKIGGNVSLAGAQVSTTFGNSVHGLELTGGGNLSGRGDVFLGNSGLFGSSGTKLSPNGGTLNINQSGNSTYNGQIDNTGTLAKTGIGTLSWNSATTQTFAGTLRVDAGTFHLSGNGSLSNIVVNGGMLQIDPAHRISDTASVTVNGGTFFLNSYNEEVGALSGTGGTVNLGVGNLRVNHNTNGTYNGNLTGSNSSVLTKTGASTLTWNPSTTHTFNGGLQIDGGTFQLSGNGSIAGNITVNGGMLQVDPAHRIADSSSLTLNGGTFFLNSYNEEIGALSGTGGTVNLGVGNLRVNQTTNASYAGTLQGSASSVFVKTGAAYLDMLGTSSNSFNGVIQVDQGILYLNKSSGAVATSGNVVVNGGNLWVYQSNQIADAASVQINSGLFTVGSGTGTVTETVGGLAGAGTVDIRTNGILSVNNSSSSATYSGAVAGDGRFIKTGSSYIDMVGTLPNSFTGVMQVDQGILYLNKSSGAVATSGNVVVNGGNLWVYQSNQIADSSSVTINSGIFTVGTGSGTVTETIGSLTGAGTVDLRTNATLTVNNAANISYGGALAGSGNFVKSGTGTLTLAGSSHAHTGGISVSQGALIINGTVASSGNAITVASAGKLGGSGVLNRPVAIAGTIAPGNGVGQITLGNTTLQPGGTLEFEYLASAHGTTVPGTTHDHLLGTTGSILDLSVLSPANRFNINVKMINDGNASSDSVTYTFATYGTITGLPSSDMSSFFNITGDFTGSATVLFVDGATFDTLSIRFTPVPEPLFILSFVAPALLAIGVVRHRRAAREVMA